MSGQISSEKSETSTLMNEIKAMSIKILGSCTLPLYFCFACFGIAILIGLLITQAGPGISPDSTGYISAAENIFSGKGFFIGYGESSSHYTVWPPLYPLLIASLMQLGFDVEQAARLIPIFSFALLMFPIFFLGREIESDFTGYLSCIVCLVSWNLWYVTSFVWTEMPYIFLSALAMLCLVRYWKSDPPRIEIIMLCGVFTALGVLTRYIGVTVLLVGITTIFLKSRTQIRRSMYHVALYGTISSLPIGIWVIRNVLLGVPMSGGERWGSATNIVGNIVFTIAAIGRSLFPFIHDYMVGVVVGIGIVILFVVGVIWYRNIIVKTLRLLYPHYLRNNAVTLLYISVYLSVLIAMSTFWHFDSINSRLISPAYPFIVLTGISLVLAARHHLEDPSHKKRFYAVILLVTTAYVFGQVCADISFSQNAKEGQGYNAPQWRENHGVGYIKEHASADALIYTNEVSACRFLLRGMAASPLPSAVDSSTTESFITKCKNQQIHILYFKDSGRAAISVEDLNELINKYYIIEEVADFPDAKIYHSPFAKIQFLNHGWFDHPI